MSYKGMNVEVEKLMQSKATTSQAEVDDEDESEVSVPSIEVAKVFKKHKAQHKQNHPT